MHKFLRAIGFSKVKTREQLQKLIDTVKEDASEKRFAINKDDQILYGDYSLEAGPGFGIRVCGDFDQNDEFFIDHYYPYLEGSNISTTAKSMIDRHVATVSFAGVCEDDRIGISIIYYLINRVEYIMKVYGDSDDYKNAPISLTGLADTGMIMMPIAKTEMAKRKEVRSEKKRDKLIKAAREGDEKAIESLTLDDMDVYSKISRKVKEADIYTIVDTYFMPYGVECDRYSVLGEITDFEEVENYLTKEAIYKMTINCNGLMIDICINKNDLFGEPEVGRRFKGNIWLQGQLLI